MSVSPPVHAHSSNDGDRQSTDSPFFPRISGANTIARPSPMHTIAGEETFPAVKLQAKMVMQTPLPYQTQEFRPCIVLKKFEPSLRVSDSFVAGVPTDDALGEFKKKRTVILHTDRYAGHGQIRLETDSQQLRLQQEGQMLQDARSRMRLREALAHRARHDLHLGGNPMAQDQPAPSTIATEDEIPTKKKLDKLRRLKKLRRPADQHQLPFAIQEEFPEDFGAARRRHGGQLVSHSSAPSVPALNLGHQQRTPAQLGASASFVSRSEFDALAALIGAEGAAAEGGALGSGGLDKVKLDGSKAVFNRRSDILAELSRLRAIVLPDFAKDLYVGRGIRLPGSHALNNPRKTLHLGDDLVLDALLNRAQQPIRITDEGGNILISTGGSQQPRRANRQVFAADVTVRPTVIDSEPSKHPERAQRRDSPPELLTEEADPGHGQEPAAETRSAEEPQDAGPPLPEPFLGLSSGWAGDSEAEGAAVESLEEVINQQLLPAGVAGYLREILSASSHTRAGSIAQELARLIGQRLAAEGGGGGGGGGASSAQQSSLVGWLRRGLDLFHDVDREVKGSVSLPAFLDILSSMRGLPLDESEAALIRDSFGLSGDSVSKLAFLTVLPFLLHVLIV